MQVHSHSVASLTATPRKVRIALAALVVPFLIATIASAAVLWPHDVKHVAPDNLGAPTTLVKGDVAGAVVTPCAGDGSLGDCNTVTINLANGPERGTSTTLVLQQGPSQPMIHTGDKVVLGRAADPTGAVVYYFTDFQRKLPLAAFGAVFALIVVGVARWRGFGALLGLGVTWLTVTQFMLPSILEGHSPVAVALTGSAFIVLVVLYVAHGFSVRTTTAVAGTLVSLAATGGLAALAVKLTHVTGLASEETTYVQHFAGNVDLQGLLLGGIILGSIGVLNDTTVTQASAAWEIHIAQPLRSRRDIYRSTMRVGRDHIASTVYTLVLAYTGAALPMLLLFTITDRRVADVMNSGVVAEEIVRTLAGGIGLVLSVPITSAIATAVVKAEARATQAAAGEEVGESTESPESVDDSQASESVESETQAPAEDTEIIDVEPRSTGAIDLTDTAAPREPVTVVASSYPELKDSTIDSPPEAGYGEPAGSDELPWIAPPRPETPVMRRRLRSFGRKVQAYEETRRMSRRERKFWSED